MAIQDQHASSPATAGTTQAIVQDRYGDADVLRLDRAAMPVIADHEVLLEVRAAGLDRGAWHLMTGRPYVMRLALGLRGPRQPILGREVAGTVLAVGPAVTRFAVGDEVFGIGRGTFARHTAARADKLAHKPAALTFEQAAVTTVSALTALQALTDAGRIQPGQQVLVIGASGGVGSYAVQLARAFGAHVTGVCSPAKRELVRSLGAEHTIDYAAADFADGPRRYDLILDITGNPSLARLRRALTPAGTAVIVGGEHGGDLTGGLNRQFRALALSPFIGQRLTTVLCKERGADLERLAALIEAGQVVPSIDRCYPLDRAPEAMHRLATGQAHGKIAITV